MRHSITILAALVTTASPACASETPSERYDFDTACFAVTRAAAAASGLSGEDREHAAVLRPLYAKRLAESAPAFGKTRAQAIAEVVEIQRASRRFLHSHDPTKVREELADLHKWVRNCAAIPVFEVLDRMKGK